MVAKKPRAGKASKLSLPPPERLDPLGLILDPKNPRFSDEEQAQPAKALEHMLREYDLDELAESIITSGFVNADPIIAVRTGTKVTVLEGNRRVATLQLLLEPTRAPPKYQKKWTAFSARLKGAARKSAERIDVSVVGDRRDDRVLAYIGFRHVTGILKWDAYEKARYIAELGDEEGWSYALIAERLGHKPITVERNYVAFHVAEQARTLGLEGHEQLRSSFGILFRALQSSGVQEFLKVDFPGEKKKSREPVKASKADFAFFIIKTFGSGDQERFVPESRDITEWGDILRSPTALRYVRENPKASWERAFLLSGGASEAVAQLLYDAAEKLAEAADDVGKHKANTEVRAAAEECAVAFSRIIRHFPATAKKQGLTTPKKR